MYNKKIIKTIMNMIETFGNLFVNYHKVKNDEITQRKKIWQKTPYLQPYLTIIERI